MESIFWSCCTFIRLTYWCSECMISFCYSFICLSLSNSERSMDVLRRTFLSNSSCCSSSILSLWSFNSLFAVFNSEFSFFKASISFCYFFKMYLYSWILFYSFGSSFWVFWVKVWFKRDFYSSSCDLTSWSSFYKFWLSNSKFV